MELRNLEQDSKPSLLSTNIQVSFEMSSFVTLFWWPQSQIYRSFLYFLGILSQFRQNSFTFMSGTDSASCGAWVFAWHFSSRHLSFADKWLLFRQSSACFSFKLLLASHFFLWPLPCLVFQTTKATALNAWLKTARKVSKGRPATISVQGNVQYVIRVGSKDKHDPWHKTTKQPDGYIMNIQ